MDEKKTKEASPKEREKEKDDSKKSQEKQSPGPRGNKPLFAGIIAGVIVVEAILGIFLVKMIIPQGPSDGHAEKMLADSLQKIEEESTTMGATTAEAPIEVIVNISGTDGERFLKAAIVLEYEERGEKKPGGGGGHGEKAAKSPLASAIEERMPKFKSILIEHLSKLPLAECTAPDATQKLRRSLLHSINGTLPPKLGEVKNIYFTEFIIQ